MTILSILQYPDPRLKHKAELVTNVQDAAVQQIIADILETLFNTPNCAGLAATQLNIPNPPSITVLNREESSAPLCLINPEIIAQSGETYEPEGCMSIYPQHISTPVKRAAQVTVKALDKEGKEITIEADGFLAKCLQHEIDHLNGILFLDHLSTLKRHLIEKKILKLRAK